MINLDKEVNTLNTSILTTFWVEIEPQVYAFSSSPLYSFPRQMWARVSLLECFHLFLKVTFWPQPGLTLSLCKTSLWEKVLWKSRTWLSVVRKFSYTLSYQLSRIVIRPSHKLSVLLILSCLPPGLPSEPIDGWARKSGHAYWILGVMWVFPFIITWLFDHNLASFLVKRPVGKRRHKTVERDKEFIILNLRQF